MWDVILDFIFNIVSFFNDVMGDWGLAIIAITIIFRLLLIPIMHKQTKSSEAMKKLNPEMKRIQELYANDKAKLSEEMQKLYAEAKFNPISGCIPMFIQIPIFMALFNVLRNKLPEVIGDGKCSFLNIVPNLLAAPSEMWEIGFIDAIPYIVLLLIFACCTFVPMLIQQTGTDEKQKKQQLLMAGGMSIFMLFMGWGSPAGVLLFWGTSSIIAIIQQRISMRIIANKNKSEEEQKEYEPVVVNVERKEKNKRQKKKK